MGQASCCGGSPCLAFIVARAKPNRCDVKVQLGIDHVPSSCGSRDSASEKQAGEQTDAGNVTCAPTGNSTGCSAKFGSQPLSQSASSGNLDRNCVYRDLVYKQQGDMQRSVESCTDEISEEGAICIGKLWSQPGAQSTLSGDLDSLATTKNSCIDADQLIAEGSQSGLPNSTWPALRQPVPQSADDAHNDWASSPPMTKQHQAKSQVGDHYLDADDSKPADPHHDADVDAQIDLAKLCAAFRSLEASTTRPSSRSSSKEPGVSELRSRPTDAVTFKSPAQDSQMLLGQSGNNPASGTLSGTSSPMMHQESRSQVRLAAWTEGAGSCSTNSTITPSTATGTSGDDPMQCLLPDHGIGRSLVNSMAVQRQGTLSRSALMSPSASMKDPGLAQDHLWRARDKERMDAWFQRVLAKGGDKSDLVPASIDPAEPESQLDGSKRPLPILTSPSRALGPQLSVVTTPPSTSHTTREETLQASQSDRRAFQLQVLLGGEAVGTLSFHLTDLMPTMCKEFLTEHHLRDIFLEPLQTHAELMVHMDRQVDEVDIINCI